MIETSAATPNNGEQLSEGSFDDVAHATEPAALELPAVLVVEAALPSEASDEAVVTLPAVAETLQVEPALVAESKPVFVMPESSSSPANLDSFIVTGPILPVVFQPQQQAPSPARHKAAHGPKLRAKRAWANAVVISLTGGLVATVALPAYATTNTSAITASSATQYVENIALLSKGTAAAPITRDLYAGVSADQIAALTTDDGTFGTEMTASQYLALNPDYREYEGGKDGSQDYSVWDSIDIAISEVGTSRFTGWGAPGECIVSAQRWINSAGGKFDAGGVVDGYSSSGAQKVDLSDVQPGDVIQYTSTSWPNEFVVGVHTVLIIGVNADGTLDIVQSNAPAGSGLVTLVANWKPQPPEGFEPIAWRFGSIN